MKALMWASRNANAESEMLPLTPPPDISATVSMSIAEQRQMLTR